jgi:hypothetical protein
MFLQSATVVKQPADNSCLFHSLHYNLSYEDLYNDVYKENTGFSLRTEVNEYIRDNPAHVIFPTPDVPETFAEAIAAEGYCRTDYFNRMALNTSWGGMIEICAVAELYEVNISIFQRNDDPERRFKWTGTFKYSLNNALTVTLKPHK